MTKILTIKLSQGGLNAGSPPVDIYVGKVTLAQLRQHAKVDRWSPATPTGYQRPLEARRLRDIGKYVLEQEGVLPTSLLCGTRRDDEPSVSFEPVPGMADLTWVDFPEDATIWVIDGQNRFGGVDDAFERSNHDERVGAYEFPVAIMRDIDQYTEMIHFDIVNTRQKKMSTDIVDRHLLMKQRESGIDMLARGAKGQKEYNRATATQLADDLNETAGPWLHKIQVPGVPGRDQGLIRQHAFVTSLDTYLKDPWVRGCRPEEQLKVLVNFWRAAAEVWPEAFAEPAAYRVQATAGIYSLHGALPVLIQRCLDSQDVTQVSMARILRESGIKSDFWSKEDGVGDPLTVGTSMSSIRMLTQYIVNQLPSGARAGVKI